MEAFKFVLWPREEKQLEGNTVYWYVAIGTVMTDIKPKFNGKNEIVVMDSIKGMESITGILEEAQRYIPPYPLGDASSALISVSEFSPENCKKDMRAD